MRHIFIHDPEQLHEKYLSVESILETILLYFKTREDQDLSIQVPDYPGEAIGIIQEQAEKAKTGDTVRVYSIGGGRILFDCLNGIAGIPNSELAIMPFGFNVDFLRVFENGKVDRFNDIRLIDDSAAVPTDIIKAGKIYALNNCCIGIAAAAAGKKKEAGNRETAGSYHYHRFITALTNAFAVFDRNITTHHYNITVDGKTYSGNYIHICIANGPYYNGKKTALKAAVPDDGLLDIALLKTFSPLTALFSMKKFLRGKTPDHCIIMQAKKITIQSHEPFWLQTDDEFAQETNVAIEVIPRAVRIVSANLSYPQHEPVSRIDR